MFSDVLEQMMKKEGKPGDYERDGVLVCGRCHSPKQVLLTLPALTGDDMVRPFPIQCACEKEKADSDRAKEEATRFYAKMDSMWRNGVHDSSLMRYTFSDDDGEHEAVSKVCRRYTEKWPEMLEDNVGMLFFGPVGVGKSFFASCVLNEVITRQVPVCATSFPRILNVLQSSFDGRQETLDRLVRFPLLLLDDLGAERGSEYALEQIFSVVDARYRTGKPVILTTNLTLKELESPQNLAYSRIFDRVLEMCPIRLAVTGESRRKANAESRKQLAQKILLGERHGN